MIIYKDIVSGDEIISDGYPLKEIDDTFFEVDTKMVAPKGEDFVLDGANPSAEGEDEEEGGSGGGEQVEKVPELVLAFGLTKMLAFSKDEYKSHIKTYLKKVKAKLQETSADEAKVKAFENGAKNNMKKILGNLDNFDFYTGSSMDPDGMHVLLDYREDGITPYLIIWKHGLTEMKV